MIKKHSLSSYMLLLAVLAICFPFNITAQDFKEVKPAKGDGVYSILRRYNLDPSNYFEKFIELNKDKLGDNFQIKMDQIYRLPALPANTPSQAANQFGVFPIFGKKHEKVEFKDDKLRGAVFYIVAGHGGPDPGAVGSYIGNMLCEDEYAYDIGLRLARSLLEHNATVYVIIRDPDDGIRDASILKCDKDEYCWGDLTIPRNHISRLKQRSEAINKISDTYKGIYQRTIELHVDSRNEGQNVDIFFYHHPNSTKGKELNRTLYKTIKAKYDEHQPNRGYRGTISGRRLYTLRHANPVASYIELGNIQNNRDQRRLLIVENRQAIANWLTLGLIADYENSK
jgi:N-acetylmuramoyl-L-alanine amidase